MGLCIGRQRLDLQYGELRLLRVKRDLLWLTQSDLSYITTRNLWTSTHNMPQAHEHEIGRVYYPQQSLHGVNSSRTMRKTPCYCSSVRMHSMAELVVELVLRSAASITIRST